MAPELGRDLVGILAALQEADEGERAAFVRIEAELERVRLALRQARMASEITQHVTTAPILSRVTDFLERQQLSLQSTLEYLVESECSFARFGDGEIRAMLSPWFRFSFQANSADLMLELRSVLQSASSELLVGLPQAERDSFWSGLYAQVWGELEPMLSPVVCYGNTQVSRPIAFELLGDVAVDLWRRVWAGKDVRIITGQGSRFDILPELFDSARAVDRFDSLATNAYVDSARVLRDGASDSPDLVLLSLGPTGTTLARSFHGRGVRALDVGHLSASFLNVFSGGKKPEQLPTG